MNFANEARKSFKELQSKRVYGRSRIFGAEQVRRSLIETYYLTTRRILLAKDLEYAERVSSSTIERILKVLKNANFANNMWGKFVVARIKDLMTWTKLKAEGKISTPTWNDDLQKFKTCTIKRMKTYPTAYLQRILDFSQIRLEMFVESWKGKSSEKDKIKSACKDVLASWEKFAQTATEKSFRSEVKLVVRAQKWKLKQIFLKNFSGLLETYSSDRLDKADDNLKISIDNIRNELKNYMTATKNEKMTKAYEKYKKIVNGVIGLIRMKFDDKGLPNVGDRAKGEDENSKLNVFESRLIAFRGSKDFQARHFSSLFKIIKRKVVSLFSCDRSKKDNKCTIMSISTQKKYIEI